MSLIINYNNRLGGKRDGLQTLNCRDKQFGPPNLSCFKPDDICTVEWPQSDSVSAETIDEQRCLTVSLSGTVKRWVIAGDPRYFSDTGDERRLGRVCCVSALLKTPRSIRYRPRAPDWLPLLTNVFFRDDDKYLLLWKMECRPTALAVAHSGDRRALC